jgi:hypothetical protein
MLSTVGSEFVDRDFMCPRGTRVSVPSSWNSASPAMFRTYLMSAWLMCSLRNPSICYRGYRSRAVFPHAWGGDF